MRANVRASVILRPIGEMICEVTRCRLEADAERRWRGFMRHGLVGDCGTVIPKPAAEDNLGRIIQSCENIICGRCIGQIGHGRAQTALQDTFRTVMDALDFEVISGMTPNGVIMALCVSPNRVKVLNGNGVLGKKHSVARNAQHRCAIRVPAVGQCAPLEAYENVRICAEAAPSVRIQPWGICCKMKRATRVLFKRNGLKITRMESARDEAVAQDRCNALMRRAVPQVADPILRDSAATWDRRTEPRRRHSGGKPIEAHPRDRMTLRTTNKNNIVRSGRWSFTTRAGRGPLVKELIPALIIASHMSDESVPICAMVRGGFTLVREPSADLLHEVRETNPSSGVHVDPEVRISARTMMAKKGTEPSTETLNKRIPSPVRRIVTIPWAEVEADSQ